MSVRTEADERLDSARENLGSAVKDMSKIVIDRCWGWDDYEESATQRHRLALNKLIEIRELLG